ncbi:MAG: hypothetical protein EOO45_09670 [Flavobacterium sp.]|nr:MAG: hypothetical protein EOO45_09670 [Flavobacterium sp.]
MTKEEFEVLWTNAYPLTPPIPHLFKHNYPERWFRIHSLPNAKRFADTDQEWDTIIYRQNKIITDLIGNNSEVLLVMGQYNKSNGNGDFKSESESFDIYKFSNLDAIDLNTVDYYQDYEDDMKYIPAFCKTTWTIDRHNKLLREIARDNVRAFFISPEQNILIAPYDGGIDIVLNDIETRDQFKTIYSDWLSSREDGY